MQTVGKYTELYQKKHQHNLDLRDLKNDTYVQYLETQLDKVTATVNLVQSFDERMTDLERDNVVLREKLQDQAKYIRLFQSFTEIQVIIVIKEEENTTARDMLADLSSRLDSSSFDNQFELMKSSCN